MLLQYGWTAFNEAAYGGHGNVISLLLHHDPSLILKANDVSKHLHHMGYMYVSLI